MTDLDWSSLSGLIEIAKDEKKKEKIECQSKEETKSGQMNKKDWELQNNIEFCSNCGEKVELKVSSGIHICPECGAENGTNLSDMPDWRHFSSEDSRGSKDPTRCGMPTNPLLKGPCVGSVIAGKSYDNWRRLHVWHQLGYKDRAFLNICEEIKAKVINGGLPPIIGEEACYLFRFICQERISRGKMLQSLKACSVYQACKLKNCMRSEKEIAELWGMDKKILTKGIKKYDELFEMKNKRILPGELGFNIKLNTDSSHPSDFIPRFCSKLGISDTIKSIILNVSEKAIDMEIVSENTPPSIAVGCIFLVSENYKLQISKKDIHNATDVSEVTISKTYKKLVPYTHSLLN